jgi:hypothetical protein
MHFCLAFGLSHWQGDPVLTDHTLTCTCVLSMQMAASSAAVHGWPSATLSLLLSAIERSAMRVESTRYRSQLTLSLLAKPLRLALQQHRQELADMTMAMLARHVVADRCGALADSLLLLAYQVGRWPTLHT